ncbi:MAG TPA: oligopeptide transporter, OPT family [Thermoanaerobaculaceae bacterium]|nr:oligopeptide transporter, OPT family [Thermoanaerobaculaceae bacterium]HRS15953.1 oligopeptide transporter, OPT family [Thermoanaerobaculaceae bacterium]
MSERKFTPFVPAHVTQSEFTLRALLIGLGMCVVLGAANAYLGLRAGMTIAATYPAAVIGMALLRIGRGSILEENFARTVGSIGESVAAGAIFTIPAFVILQLWHFDREHMVREYLLASALMVLGGILGIMFVTVLRRVMVEDPSLPFPESVAASEIHKAGQKGAEAALQLFRAMGVGAVVRCLDALGIFRSSNDFHIAVGKLKDGFVRLGLTGDARKITVGGVSTFSAPAVTPAYLGVGFIIGPELGALNFAGGLLAWGLFVPLLIFFLGPSMIADYTSADGVQNWAGLVGHLYRFVVRPIAVGGMLVGACYTLYRMRARLAAGLKRSIADVKKSAVAEAPTERTELDLSFKAVLLGILAIVCAMVAVYYLFTGAFVPAAVAALVMVITGFFFAAVSGNLVGTIGSSNNPLSGLTLATTIVAALTMVIIGAKGTEGVAAVLAVAAIGCVSAAVAGEMLQDLKVGHILGGTPWKMQVGDIIGVVVAGLVMFFPLYMMYTSDVAQFGEAGGFGGRTYPAPQAGLMAALSQGIVGGEMAWPLVLVGIAMGISLILVRVKSPMLFSVGMYLPLETTFAIFVGGVVRGIMDKIRDKRGYNEAQKARVENAGVLAASGLIAGEALMGLFVAAVVGLRSEHAFWNVPQLASVAPWLALPVAAFLIWYLIAVPLRKAGAADEPAPPTAVM